MTAQQFDALVGGSDFEKKMRFWGWEDEKVLITVLLKTGILIHLQSKIEVNRHRGVVERFIAPVLKTGDPLRGPGVRIPPPLHRPT